LHLDLTAARAARHDDVVKRLEFGEQLFCQHASGARVARVVGRLAAAGLPFGHDDLESGRFEQPDCREADLGTDGVDQAGYE
jgi:hypothetical protein